MEKIEILQEELERVKEELKLLEERILVLEKKISDQSRVIEQLEEQTATNI